MIAHEQTYTPALEKRFHRLAGPFDLDTKWILESMRKFLTETGARTTTVGEADGVCLWRLRSECETMAETEARLARCHHRRPTPNPATTP